MSNDAPTTSHMKVTPSKLRSLLIPVLDAGLVPMIHGSPGTGKSDLVRSIAKEFKLWVIDFRLSQADPTDMAGFPTINKERTRCYYTPPIDFPLAEDEIPEGYNGWLLFFDEMNTAPPSVQAASYKIILDRMVGQNHLHKAVAMLAAGNLSTDKAITNRMSTAMQSRLIHYEMAIKQKDWIKWAYNNDIDHRIISFISFKPGILQDFNPNHNDYTFPCPRTWEFTSKIIKPFAEVSADMLITLTGTIGPGAAREFFTFCQIYKTLPTLQAIAANPTGLAVPEEPATKFALSGMLGNGLNESNAENLMKYVTRMPVEFQIMSLQNAVKKDKSLMKLKEIRTWISTYGREMY